MSSQKPARSQPEANQTSFFDSQKPAKQRPDLARQQGVKEVQPFSGRPRKPTRGIVQSTLLRLWEGQCLHKAAPRQRGGPASFSQVSTRFFQAGGCPTRKPARSQPEASPNQTSFFDSQKPAKPGKQRPDLARQPGPCRELRKCSLFRDVQGDRRLRGIVPSTLLRLWEGQCLHKAAPQAAGRSSQFQPGKYEIFPGREMSNQKASQKPARSQPEANQTSF